MNHFSRAKKKKKDRKLLTKASQPSDLHQKKGAGKLRSNAKGVFASAARPPAAAAAVFSCRTHASTTNSTVSIFQHPGRPDSPPSRCPSDRSRPPIPPNLQSGGVGVGPHAICGSPADPKLVFALGPRRLRAASSYALAASSAVLKVPSHLRLFFHGSRISAANRPHGRFRTPRKRPSPRAPPPVAAAISTRRLRGEGKQLRIPPYL